MIKYSSVEMIKKVSIIVPVYNASKFLSQTLSALAGQTYSNIEIICVNDGSEDNSLQILEEAAKKDFRFKVFDQINAGPAKARNVALENVTGEYLMFCDADDWYESTMVEEMLCSMTREDVDLVMCDCSLVIASEKRGRNEESLNCHYLKYFDKILLTQILKSKINVLLWNKIFKLDLIRKYSIKFPEGFESDDNAFVYQYLAVSEVFFGLNRKIYNYRVLDNSLMGRVYSQNKVEKLFDYIDVFVFTIAFLRKNDLFSENKWIIKIINNNIYHVSKFFNTSDREKYILLLKKKVLSYYDVDDLVGYSELAKIYNKKGYFFGYPLWEKRKTNKRKEYYILGKRIFSKRNKNTNKVLGDVQSQLSFLKNSIHNELNDVKKMNLIMQTAISYKDIPKSERYVVCFDCLYDKYAETIDAYSIFLYLQKNNIKSKYIILKSNPKAKDLVMHKDVVFVSDQYDFLYNNIDIVAKSSYILTSFGGLGGFNKKIKSFPFVKYIFIDHGVIWLKKWVCSIYSQQNFDYVLVPSKKTKELYLKRKIWSEDKMICSGLPRWDSLEKKCEKQKNIFIFFTWRKTFEKRPDLSTPYVDGILSLLNSPAIQELVEKKSIKINLSLHHAFLYGKNEYFNIPNYINLVCTSQVSSCVRESDLLITDYSSICFDFMYLNKPVLFYLFDANGLWLNELDQEALLDVMQEEKELYNYCYSEKSLLEKVNYYIKNNFILEPENIEKNEQIFFDRTENNCEKFYQCLLKIE